MNVQGVAWESQSPKPLPGTAKRNEYGKYLWHEDGKNLWVPGECVQGGMVRCKPRECDTCARAAAARGGAQAATYAQGFQPEAWMAGLAVAVLAGAFAWAVWGQRPS